MKTIVSALIALSLLAGIAGSTNALDVTKFWDEHLTSGERQSSDLIHHFRSFAAGELPCDL